MLCSDFSFVVDMNLPYNILAKMFEESLSTCIRDKVSIQRLKKFGDTDEVALITDKSD